MFLLRYFYIIFIYYRKWTRLKMMVNAGVKAGEFMVHGGCHVWECVVEARRRKMASTLVPIWRSCNWKELRTILNHVGMIHQIWNIQVRIKTFLQFVSGYHQLQENFSNIFLSRSAIDTRTSANRQCSYWLGSVMNHSTRSRKFLWFHKNLSVNKR